MGCLKNTTTTMMMIDDRYARLQPFGCVERERTQPATENAGILEITSFLPMSITYKHAIAVNRGYVCSFSLIIVASSPSSSR